MINAVPLHLAPLDHRALQTWLAHVTGPRSRTVRAWVAWQRWTREARSEHARRVVTFRWRVREFPTNKE